MIGAGISKDTTVDRESVFRGAGLGRERGQAMKRLLAAFVCWLVWAGSVSGCHCDQRWVQIPLCHTFPHAYLTPKA